MIIIKSFLTGVLYNGLKLIRGYLNEGTKVCECYSCLKMMIQYHLHVIFFTIFFIERAPLKRFYLHMELLPSSTIFEPKNNHEVSLAIKIFA